MANFVNELNSLNFAAYIGGPIQAAVDAQNSASMNQVEFIQKVGLDENKEVKMAIFKYDTSSVGESGAVITNTVTLNVPLLAMLSVPSLRIDEMTIDFNCKLNSVETKDVSTDFSGTASAGLNLKKFNFQVSASYQHKTASSEKVERTYSMVVHVRVVNDEMPAGLDRVLSMMEDAISTSTALKNSQS